jgi:hypothetical protein
VYYNIKPKPVITTLVYATPIPLFCGASYFFTVKLNIILFDYNDTRLWRHKLALLWRYNRVWLYMYVLFCMQPYSDKNFFWLYMYVLLCIQPYSDKKFFDYICTYSCVYSLTRIRSFLTIYVRTLVYAALLG